MTRDTVLHNAQEANCSDPRDKLYAILGIVEDAADVQIDYSMSVPQVYQNWAINRIRRTGTLDILRLCSNYNRSGDLPSWVPDLRQRWGQDTILWMSSPGLTFNINNRLRFVLDPPRYIPKTIPSSAGVGLEVMGCNLACIKHLSTAGDAVTNLQDPAELTTRLKAITTQWELLFRNNALSLFVNWLSIFPTRVLRVGDAFSKHYEIWAGKQDALRRSAHNLDFSNQESQNVELNMFERHLFPRLHGCQMFITESGHPGVMAGDCNALEGDEVWTLFGDASHFLLRRTVGGYRLISPCHFPPISIWDEKLEDVERIILV